MQLALRLEPNRRKRNFGDGRHSGAESGELCVTGQRRMVALAWMENIMSKTLMHNSEAMSNHVRELPNQANELTTDELEHVSGGYGHIQFTYYPQKRATPPVTAK